jgi:hypothetical protein
MHRSLSIEKAINWSISAGKHGMERVWPGTIFVNAKRTLLQIHWC